MARCLVVTPFRDLHANLDRLPGELVEVEDEGRLRRWTAQGLIRAFPEGAGPEWPWDGAGRELRAVLPPRRKRPRVVACLNLWNDAPALRDCAPTWLPLVDKVVAVDGVYRETVNATAPGSTDGSVELLRRLLPRGVALEIVRPPAGCWPDQLAKRNAYLARLEPGDLAFVVDADEAVAAEGDLRDFDGDVGWVRMRVPSTYKRSYNQPRLFRFRPGLEYRGRHHWLWLGDDLVASHQYGGQGFEHRLAPLVMTNVPDNRPPGRLFQRAAQRAVQSVRESAARALSEGDGLYHAREALRILQLGTIDPGLVAYRLHTALNVCTPHSSVLGIKSDDNPFEGPRQFGLVEDRLALELAFRDADVVHVHADWFAHDVLGIPDGGVKVIHHHGTMFRRDPAAANRRDAERGASLRLVSNLELTQYAEDVRFLPNVVPAAAYRRLAEALRPAPDGRRRRRRDGPPPRPFRVSHSPSKRELKGTDAFLAAVGRLRARGVAIEAVLIERMPHGQALEVKAACDATFDSFWLGMQCSGIEAAAMGQPVLAGDEYVTSRALQEYGYVPWTYAGDGKGLEEALERLATDPAFRADEAARVQGHVFRHHSEPAVALRYLELLDRAVGWRDRLTLR